jgi:hypothetical protein
MKLTTQDCRSDSSRSVREADRCSEMATEGHRKKSKAEKLSGWDEEEMTRKLYELKADIEKMELRMRQDRRRRRLRELPMEKAKAKWPVRELMVIRQRRLLKRWLRYAEDLRATEEDMICHCWPESGKSLDDDDDDWNKLESVDGFKYCRLGRKEEIPVCQEDNELGSIEDLKDCREDSQGISNGQLGMDQRSRRGLEDCQEGSESIEDCQEGSGSVLSCLVGKDEKLRLPESLMDSGKSSIQQGLLMKMGLVDLMVCKESRSGSIPYGQMGRDDLRNKIQPGELTEHISSQEDQQMKLTEEENQNDILMIGGIEIFLPFSQEEAENSVQNATTAGEQSQLMMTVKEEKELEQAFETAQTDEEKNDCSEEQLNKFSQQAERVAAFELTVKEIEGGNEHSEEWLDIFSISAEKTATWEVAEAEEEDTDSICLTDLWGQIEALEERVKVQGVHIQQLKLEVDKKGVGDHDDLSIGQNLLQLRRLQRQSQPQEQLDREIEDIRRLMLRSVQITSEEKLGREKAAVAAAQRKQQQQQNGADEKLQRLVWDPGGFPTP